MGPYAMGENISKRYSYYKLHPKIVKQPLGLNLHPNGPYKVSVYHMLQRFEKLYHKQESVTKVKKK